MSVGGQDSGCVALAWVGGWPDLGLERLDAADILLTVFSFTYTYMLYRNKERVVRRDPASPLAFNTRYCPLF